MMCGIEEYVLIVNKNENGKISTKHHFLILVVPRVDFERAWEEAGNVLVDLAVRWYDVNPEEAKKHKQCLSTWLIDEGVDMADFPAQSDVAYAIEATRRLKEAGYEYELQAVPEPSYGIPMYGVYRSPEPRSWCGWWGIGPHIGLIGAPEIIINFVENVLLLGPKDVVVVIDLKLLEEDAWSSACGGSTVDCA